MPILFSAAEEHTGIIYWAITDSVVVDDDKMTCRYFDLRRIAPARPRPEVQLKAGNQPLSGNLIRPYEISWAPHFLASRTALLRATSSVRLN